MFLGSCWGGTVSLGSYIILNLERVLVDILGD